MNEIIVANPAKWSVSLDVECPHCAYEYDLTQYETMSELPMMASKTGLNIETLCPQCTRIFTIDEVIAP